jgi:integrase
MNTEISEVEKSVENEKKGTPRGHLAPVSPFPSTPEAEAQTARAAKSSVEFWKAKIRPRTLKDGTITPELYIRLKQGGHDAWFNLGTPNRATAATKARDIWQAVQVKGLAAVQAGLRPAAAPLRSATVGALITAAKALSGVRSRTFASYEVSLRRVVAGVLKLEGTAARFAHDSAANREWRGKIDRVRLDTLTPAKVEAWRKSFVDAAPNENARSARQHSAATYIRNGRALFSERLLPILKEQLILPAVLPFAGLGAGAGTRRFASKVDARALYAAAQTELANDADTLTAFLLCLVAGLRKGEADALPWANVDFTAGTVRIATTPWFTPKTRESAREIPLPADVLAFLKVQRETAPAAEFVLTGRAPRAAGRGYEYRARAWKPLAAWLRSNGMVTRNPIHELRKLSGSIVNSSNGLEAARQHLGHATIATTSASYLAPRSAVVDLAAKP